MWYTIYMVLPKPDYERGNVRMWCADAMELLPLLPVGCVDAMVTDPPYGIGYSSARTPNCSWHEAQIDGDDSILSRDAVIAWAIERELPWASFGSWKHPVMSGVRGVLVWNKGPAFGMGDLSFPWKPSWELIFVGGPGWSGKREEGVLSGPCVVSWESKGRCHPNQKPPWIIKALVEKLPGARRILDPFMGSGTTIVVCVQTNRAAIGVEIDRKYFDIAVKKVDEAFESCALFDHVPKDKQGELF